MLFGLSFSFGSSSNLSSPSPSSIPPPPPPSPNDSLLDISPRKSSFSSASSRDTSCAFPSWPNRSSLLAEAEQSASSYISDEDLFPTSSPASPPSSSCTAWSTPMSGSLSDEVPSSTMNAVLGAPDLTTEEQIQMMREAAEEEDRRTQYLAHAQAHARAQQALRVAQLQQQNGMRRKKGRVVPDKKRRTTSSSSSGSKATSRATTTKRGMD
ncbi:hypothetical protein FQN54_006776 [Arachnomyces sp. PD_36]|nr:hypothetical protein FQN54_006776 [Arachnomyces sp. PD_36]